MEGRPSWKRKTKMMHAKGSWFRCHEYLTAAMMFAGIFGSSTAMVLIVNVLCH